MRNSLVTLVRSELYVCGLVATIRRVVSIYAHLDKNKHAYKSDWDTDFDGTCGECAAAKHYGRYWPMSVTFPGVDDASSYKKFDIDGFQVRATPWRDGHLIVRPNDKLGERYILAITVDLPVVRLVGSFSSDEAKQDCYRHTDAQGFEYWRVSQAKLHDLPDV